MVAVGRWHEDSEPAPERLCRFVPGEWPGDLIEATAAWGEACREWLEANPGRMLPHSADPVEVRMEVVRLRQEAPAGSGTTWRSGWRRNWEREAGPWDD